MYLTVSPMSWPSIAPMSLKAHKRWVSQSLRVHSGLLSRDPLPSNSRYRRSLGWQCKTIHIKTIYYKKIVDIDKLAVIFTVNNIWVPKVTGRHKSLARRKIFCNLCNVWWYTSWNCIDLLWGRLYFLNLTSGYRVLYWPKWAQLMATTAHTGGLHQLPFLHNNISYK